MAQIKRELSFPSLELCSMGDEVSLTEEDEGDDVEHENNHKGAKNSNGRVKAEGVGSLGEVYVGGVL